MNRKRELTCHINESLRESQNETPLANLCVSVSVLVLSHEATPRKERGGELRSPLLQHASRLESQRWIGRSDSEESLTGIVLVVEENSNSTRTC